MPERPDLRAITGNIREALGDCDRDALLDMLAFVFKEYIVEGPPPMLINQVERLPDLAGLSFAQLITALQTRLDHPELELFQVDGEQVQVRVGGTLTPLGTPRGQAPGAPSVDARPPAQARPTPGVRVVETDIVRRPAGGGQERRGDVAGMARQAVAQQMQAESSAPPPRRGMSIRGRTTGGAMMPDPSGGPGGPGGSGGPGGPGGPGRQTARPDPGQVRDRPPEQPAAEPEHPGDDDGSSTRFSLLELD